MVRKVFASYRVVWIAFTKKFHDIRERLETCTPHHVSLVTWRGGVRRRPALMR
jgi:hypothetical protein